MNYGFMDAPTREDAIMTKDKRLFVRCQFRDRTGSVDVDVIAVAVPALYSCKNEAELLNNCEMGSWSP